MLVFLSRSQHTRFAHLVKGKHLACHLPPVIEGSAHAVIDLNMSEPVRGDTERRPQQMTLLGEAYIVLLRIQKSAGSVNGGLLVVIFGV